ncbi:MAG: phosphate signaling complex protein PhoU [Bdellovibrionota bacterium]
MERSIDIQTEEIKKRILVMGGFVEQALTVVTAGLLKNDPSKLDLIFDLENRINAEHVALDGLCLTCLAKQSPVAKDLRLIMSIIKINTDLERMGDQCMNIAYTAREYLRGSSLPQAQLIEQMAILAQKMVRGSLDSFVKGDVEMAQMIMTMDDQLDVLKNEVFEILTAHMKVSSQDVEAALDLILIARNLERLGDHATNIAEDVIFVCTGRDVRHGGVYV